MCTLPAMDAAGCGVTLANIHSRSAGWGDTPTASDLFRRGRRRQVALAPVDPALYPLGKLRPSHGYELVSHALTVGGDHAVDVNQVEKALGTDFGNAGYDHPGVGVANHYDVIQRLILQELDYVADMQVEIQLRRFEHFGQVSPLAQPAQGGCVHGSTRLKEQWSNLGPAPTAMPSAMYQYEGCQNTSP